MSRKTMGTNYLHFHGEPGNFPITKGNASSVTYSRTWMSQVFCCEMQNVLHSVVLFVTNLSICFYVLYSMC